MYEAFKPWGLCGLVACAVLLGACTKDPAPKVTYQNIQGEVVGPAQYAGSMMLVNFWATSCTTCVKEMPAIVDTHQKFKDRGFRTFAVAMSYDRPDYVVSFAQTRQLPFDVVLDLKGDIAKSFKDVKVTPTTYLIDPHGQIIKTYVGEPDFVAMHKLIDDTLRKAGR